MLVTYFCQPQQIKRGLLLINYEVDQFSATGTKVKPTATVCKKPMFIAFSLEPVLWIRIRIPHYLYRSGYGSGSFHQYAKKGRKTLISTIFLLLFDFLSLNFRRLM